MVQHHKQECPVEKWGYCVQGQGHSEGLKYQWMFFWTIFCESQNILLSNLVLWYSIMSQSHADIFVVFIFKVKVTARAHMIKIWLSYIIWTVDSLAAKPGLMIHYQKPECPIKKKRITVLRVKVTVKGQNLMFVQMISSKSSNILFSNLVLWFIIMSRL